MWRLFERTAPRLVERSWNHGRFLDFWSFVHLLTGALLGLIAWSLASPLAETFLFVTGVATLYEVVEIVLKVSEDAENVLSDIILTATGGAAAWCFVTYLHLSPIDVAGTFAAIALLDVVLFLRGWSHYLQKRLSRKRP